MPTPTEAERLMALFAGNETHHGTHGTPDWDDDKAKWTIKRTALTLRDPVTITHWLQHVSGERPLGVVPVREDAACLWGSGDIDDYDVVPGEVISAIERLKYPLVVARSKSGGLHLFLFLHSPEPARQVQVVLRDMMASLGHATAEIFPKQSQLLSDRGDQGNWMVMPYFGGDFDGKLKAQVGLKRNGGEMTLGEFLRAAEAARTSTTEIKVKRKTAERKGNNTNGHGAPFGDGPPCLQHLAAAQVPRGGQSNALLMMGVYYKRSHPEDWKEQLEEANTRFLDPPGSAEGLIAVIKSLEKKEYWYTCKAEPMVSHCNAGVCRTREHGVGDAGNFPIIHSLSKLATEPVMWFVDVEGVRMDLTTSQLMEYRQFRMACLEHGSKSYAPMKDADWSAVLRVALESVTVIEASPDVGLGGQFLELLTEHLTNRQRADRPADLVGGRPWEDAAGEWGNRGAFYFSLDKLMEFIERKKVRDWTRPKVSRRIEGLGGGSIKRTIAGKFRNLWWVPGDKVHREGPLELPPEKEEKI